MEVAVEVEDDLFFADLSKQISLLIMDDEEEQPLAKYPSVSLQAFSQAIHPPQQSPLMYEQIYCRRESKGTGVFIPQSSQPRRKNRQRRFTSYNSKSYRQFDHKSNMVSQVSSNSSTYKPKYHYHPSDN